LKQQIFDINCQACPRLAKHLKAVKKDYPDYHALPVEPFGAARPDLLIVGLAPGMHGANATGRPFTGDYAGIILYETLHKFGFSNQPTSVSLNDKLKLKKCRITNAVKCLPPENKPTTTEINACNKYLQQELLQLPKGCHILVLGGIAHKAVLKALDLKIRDFPFVHGNHYKLPDAKKLFTSYHCSRYNTQTRRLTEKMFHDVFRKIRKSIDRT
jgi:uracil-DNA glycosylase family 4